MQSKTPVNTSPNATHLSVLAWTILAVCLSCVGCGSREKQIAYVLTVNEDAVTLTLGNTTLVFDGVEHIGETEQTRGGSITVSGSLVTSGSTGFSKSHQDGLALLEFDHSYRDDVVDLSLNGYKFQLLEEGTKLVCSGHTFLLDSGPRTIRIAQDGTIESPHTENSSEKELE